MNAFYWCIDLLKDDIIYNKIVYSYNIDKNESVNILK